MSDRDAKARPWTVANNGPLRKLDENLWIVRGETPGLALPLLRTMVVAKRARGDLVVHSAICVDDATRAEIEGWGEPSVLVVPNGWHKIDARAFKTRYPAMMVACPRAVRAEVEKVVAVDVVTEGLPRDEAVRLEVLDGLEKESVLIATTGDRTSLVFGDTFIAVDHLPGFWGRLYRWVGASGGPRVHPFMKWMAKKKLLRSHLERLAALPGLTRLVPGHGEPIEEDAAGVLRRAIDAM